MPRVALFSTHFLEYSQTFVYDEIRHHERYEVEVFCKKRLHEDRFPFEPIHVGGALYGATLRDSGFSRLLASGRFSLVHAHFGPGGVYAERFARRAKLPLVVTFHGYDVPVLQSLARFRPEFLRYAVLGPRVLREMTLGLCASEELLEMLASMGVSRDKLRLHHIGIDLTRFVPEPRLPDGRLEVVMIGRFVEKKGFEYGIRAFARAAKGKAARLTLIGGGELETRLRSVVRELDLEDQVQFAGILEPASVAVRLRASDVSLAPSVVAEAGNRESGLLSVKEASASGVVPIGSRHGGIPEIIDDGVTGFLVPERDVTAMADRLTALFDPELRGRMARAGREKMVRQYDNAARVRALETFYDEAIARSSRAMA